MPQAQSTLSAPTQIKSPSCQKCGRPMRLARIEPAGPGIDQRTFECADCSHVETVLVKFA